MKATEERLLELRRQAERTGHVDAKGVRAVGAPLPEAGAEHGYYGLPLLKPPVWTWEIPLYFFVGGAAGASAMIAVAAQVSGANESLVRDARRIAALGAIVSTPLLISDLGRPERFLNMLRVFKPQSPMSVGAWTLVAFSSFSTAAVFADEVQRRTALRVSFLRDASGAFAALTGLGMATYTGVLLGATAIPAWAEHVNMLPIHFAASAVASAASLLELCGHRDSALGLLASAASTYEIVATTKVARGGLTSNSLKAAALLSGAIPLALRVLGLRSKRARRAAALASLAGSLMTRFAWVEAGKASARDPRKPLGLRP
jgi:formate-dependent nitrite reductase membrane component NrfD